MSRIFLISLLLLSGCGPGESTRQDLLSCMSPNNSNRAVFYRLYGGGAAGWQTLHVSVQSGASAPEVVLSMTHGYDVELIWQGNSKLTVAYPESATIIESKKSFSGGAVLMRSQSSTTGSLAGGSQCVVAQQGIQADGLKPAASLER